MACETPDRSNSFGYRQFSALTFGSMSELHDILWSVCRKLPSDFEPYGQRDRESAESCEDCSCGCLHFHPLIGEVGMDWGVCANPKSPRAGLLTFEHQGCPEFTALPEPPSAHAEAAEEEKVAKAPSEHVNEESVGDLAPLRKLKIVEYEMLDALEKSESFRRRTNPRISGFRNGRDFGLFSDLGDYEDLIERVEVDLDRYHKIEALDSTKASGSWRNSRIRCRILRGSPACSMRSHATSHLDASRTWRIPIQSCGIVGLPSEGRR